jgi:integrase
VEVWLYAITAVRFLALTGFRRGEVLGLRWAEVDIGRRTATLTETKTGRPESKVTLLEPYNSEDSDTNSEK